MTDSHELDEILASYFRAQADGRNPDRSDLLSRHPELAAALIEFFRDYDEFNHRLNGLAKVAPGQNRSSLWAEYKHARQTLARGKDQSN